MKLLLIRLKPSFTSSCLQIKIIFNIRYSLYRRSFTLLGDLAWEKKAFRNADRFLASWRNALWLSSALCLPFYSQERTLPAKHDQHLVRLPWPGTAHVWFSRPRIRGCPAPPNQLADKRQTPRAKKCHKMNRKLKRTPIWVHAFLSARFPSARFLSVLFLSARFFERTLSKR